MISNQTITNCIEDAKKISNIDFLVADSSGIVVASTTEFNELKETDIRSFLDSDAENQEINGTLLIRIECEDEIGYILALKGIGDKFLVGKLVAAQLKNLIVAYKDKVDKNSFFQQLLLDNLLLVDIYNKAQKLHIEAAIPRCVLVIELSAIKISTEPRQERKRFSAAEAR